MSPRQVRVISAAMAAVVLVGIFVALRMHAGSATAAVPASETSHAPAVTTAQARFGPFVTRVNASGRIGAPAGSEAKLSFAGSGIIAAVAVHVGQSVAGGDTLAQLDTRGFALDVASARNDAAAAAASYGGGAVPQAALAGARARLAAAESRLHAAQQGAGTANSDSSAAQTALRQSLEKVSADSRTLDRARRLYAAGVSASKDVDAARQQLLLDQADVSADRSKVSSSSAAVGGARTQALADYQAALTEVKNAEAQVTVIGSQAGSAQTKLAQAERMLQAGTLRAAQSGVVVAILKHVGESVDPTQPAIVVGPPNSRVVTLTVSGSDGTRVRTGDVASVTDATHHSSGTGRVVGVVPNVDPSTQTTTVIVDAVPPQGQSGDAVSASIAVATERGILVPATAIVTDPQTGKSLVFVRAKDPSSGDLKFSSHEVQIAASDERTAVIATGVKNGDVIAAQGAFDLLAPSGGG
ncbi:MAG: hypothetical protein NVS2B17_29540 [Candidatus Velthaea sp.]